MTDVLAGQTIKASDAFTLNTFTPVWTGVTLGAGAINEGWYQQIGDAVLWGFRAQFGTAPALTAVVNLDLPVIAFAGGGLSLQGCLGSWIFRDSSGTVHHFSGSIGIWDAAGVQCAFSGAWDGTAPQLRIVNGGIPFTVAVDDVLSGSGFYRAA